MKRKTTWIIPLLLLLYFFVHYTSDLYCFLDSGTVLLQLLKYLLTTAALFGAGYAVVKNKERYTLAFSSVLFLFLFFGSIADTAASMHLVKQAMMVDIKTACIFLFVCVVIVVASFKLSDAMVKKLLQFWLIYCVVLMLYDAGSVLIATKAEKKYLSTVSSSAGFSTAQKPAVFFLLFDMYPSDTALKKYLNYDNGDLASFLKGKDFFVTGNARSLYSETYYSLASTLSLQPLAYFDDKLLDDYKKKLIALKNIQHTFLPALFQNSGYVFRNYSVFDLQGQPSPLQFNLNYHLANALTSTTFFNRFYEGFEPDFFLANRGVDLGWIKRSWSSNVKSDLALLDKNFGLLLDSFTYQRQPSFNYFHFMMPHPPILYDSSGKAFSVKDMYAYNGFDKTNENYTSYMKYANAVLKQMISKIFDKAGNNAVIIIQGDHGYREFSDRFPDAMRHGILNAVYLPSKNYSNFNDSIAPVQTFRQILANQFQFTAPLK